VPSLPHSPPADALDLPDLDKGEDADEVDVGHFELSLSDDEEVPEETIPIDTFEVDIQVLTDSGSNEAASDLDVGGNELMEALPDDVADQDGDALHPVGAELDLHLDTPLESDEPSSDAELGDDGLEELPELINEDGDGEAGPDLERAYLPSAPEGAIAKGPVYESEWLLLGTPASALWAGQGLVLAAAEQLMRFGSERRSQALPVSTRVVSLTRLEDDRVLMATTRGLLELGPNGSAGFLEPLELARSSGSEVVELTTARGGRYASWARLANGSLLRQRDGLWERHESGGAVRALTSHEQLVTLLVVSHRPTLQVSSDGGSSFRELLLPEPAATVALGAAPTAVSRGAVVALADAERGLCISNDGGETFRMVVGAVNVTAITLGEHAGQTRLFAALYRESKDLSELIAVDPASAKPLSIAQLSGEPDEDAEETGRTQALIFAEAELWAAGGYGLAKLRPRRA
jgi:hypothetical protein